MRGAWLRECYVTGRTVHSRCLRSGCSAKARDAKCHAAVMQPPEPLALLKPAQQGHRPPLQVKLPDALPFCLRQHFSGMGKLR